METILGWDCIGGIACGGSHVFSTSSYYYYFFYRPYSPFFFFFFSRGLLLINDMDGVYIKIQYKNTLKQNGI